MAQRFDVSASSSSSSADQARCRRRSATTPSSGPFAHFPQYRCPNTGLLPIYAFATTSHRSTPLATLEALAVSHSWYHSQCLPRHARSDPWQYGPSHDNRPLGSSHPFCSSTQNSQPSWENQKQQCQGDEDDDDDNNEEEEDDDDNDDNDDDEDADYEGESGEDAEYFEDEAVEGVDEKQQSEEGAHSWIEAEAEDASSDSSAENHCSSVPAQRPQRASFARCSTTGSQEEEETFSPAHPTLQPHDEDLSEDISADHISTNSGLSPVDSADASASVLSSSDAQYAAFCILGEERRRQKRAHQDKARRKAERRAQLGPQPGALGLLRSDRERLYGVDCERVARLANLESHLECVFELNESHHDVVLWPTLPLRM